MAYSPAADIPLNAFGAPTGNIAMANHKFTGALDGSVVGDFAGWDQLPANGVQLPYVVTGCIWTADSPGTTRNCSMTAGTIVIGGLSYAVGVVTARNFTASTDTYVDVAISGGVATITYTTVANWGTSPALAGGGTVANTIRLAVISAGATAVATAGIGQGGFLWNTNAATQPSTTVAAGSNGNAITVTPLNVASSATFIATGGWAQVAHAAGQTYLIQYTGTAAGQLTGVTLIQGTAANTVSTGDTVVGAWPIAISDMLGNRIYPTTGYPGVVGGAYYVGAFSSTLTANSPIPGTAASVQPFIVPFIIPAGGARNIKVGIACPTFGSSAAIGTSITLRTYLGNAGTPLAFAQPSVKVVSQFDAVTVQGFVSPAAPLAPGSYTAQGWFNQGAAGTITIGQAFVNTTLTVELI